jgi:DNA-directed RNA polymerase sigma subunit (sigma70/sigma32)
VNEQSLKESNAILAAAAGRTSVGELIPGSPAELAQESGIDSRLSVARAVRALMSRGRIAQEGNRYRLLDARPVEQGEQASVRRPIKRRRRGEAAPETSDDGPPTYEQLGRTLIERLIEISAEAAELRSALERARGEAEAARREAVEVRRDAATDRRRADGLEDEVSTLRKRLEMTESNLRTVVEAAKSRPASPLDDTDAKAILDILSRKEGT